MPIPILRRARAGLVTALLVVVASPGRAEDLPPMVVPEPVAPAAPAESAPAMVEPAAPLPLSPGAQPTTGRFVSCHGRVLHLRNRRELTTYTLAATATLTIDGRAARVEELTPLHKVTVTVGPAGEVTALVATTLRPRAEGDAAK